MSEVCILVAGLKEVSLSCELKAEIGAEIIEAEKATEAIKALRKRFIDIIITRWDLPDMEEGEFVRRLRWAKPFAKIVVVADPERFEKEEIAARLTGVDLVIPDNSDKGYLAGYVKRLISDLRREGAKGKEMYYMRSNIVTS